MKNLVDEHTYVHVVVDRRITPRNGVLELDFPWTSDRDAYAIRVLPALAGKP